MGVPSFLLSRSNLVPKAFNWTVCRGDPECDKAKRTGARNAHFGGGYWVASGSELVVFCL